MKYAVAFLFGCLTLGSVASVTQTSWGDILTVKMLAFDSIVASALDTWQYKDIKFPKVSFDHSKSGISFKFLFRFHSGFKSTTCDSWDTTT